MESAVLLPLIGQILIKEAFERLGEGSQSGKPKSEKFVCKTIYLLIQISVMIGKLLEAR